MSPNRTMSTSEVFNSPISDQADEERLSSSQPNARPLPKRSQTQPLTLGCHDDSATKPRLLWGPDWAPRLWSQGRVLIIDLIETSNGPVEHHEEIDNLIKLDQYFRKATEKSPSAKETNATESANVLPDADDNMETDDTKGIEIEYNAGHLPVKDRPKGTVRLRLIHVQDAQWAKEFLRSKFGMDTQDKVDGMMSMIEKQDYREGRNPILRARSSGVYHDRRRKIKRAAFQSNYLQLVPPASLLGQNQRWLALSNDDHSEQTTQSEIGTETISAYVQSISGEVDPNLEAKRQLFKHRGERSEKFGKFGSFEDWLEDWLEGRPDPHSDEVQAHNLDNGNAIIIFSDTVQRDPKKSLLVARVYDDPTDMRRATHLWKTSAAWMTMGRLMHNQKIVAQTMWSHFKALALDTAKEESCFFDDVAATYDKVFENWERNVVKRTEALSDMMYRTVGFQDSRESLQFGISMWRLSWITFIFLPLTFSVGVFGMNVDTFEANPSIWWWVLASTIILLVVLGVWYVVKHTIASRHKSPHRRNEYDKLYKDFAENHDRLWTIHGPKSDRWPRPDLTSSKWLDWKWQTVKRWFDADCVKPGPIFIEPRSDFGVWSNVKIWLAKGWLSQLDNSDAHPFFTGFKEYFKKRLPKLSRKRPADKDLEAASEHT